MGFVDIMRVQRILQYHGNGRGRFMGVALRSMSVIHWEPWSLSRSQPRNEPVRDGVATKISSLLVAAVRVIDDLVGLKTQRLRPGSC